MLKEQLPRQLDHAAVSWPGVRIRRDRIDKSGRITLRHRTRLHHIGIGKAHRGKHVIVLVDGLDIKVLSTGGELFPQGRSWAQA